MLRRTTIERFLDERWPCSLDDVRRGTRLGMGPCQGGFCTFRAAGLVAERQADPAAAAGAATTAAPGIAAAAAAGSAADGWARSDRVLVDFLAERFRGTRPIAWGRQLQELWVIAGLYSGVLGVRSLVEAAGDRAPGRPVTGDVAADPANDSARAPANVAAAVHGTDGGHAPG
jgi:glycerol-3-phosphate dehydrogenase